MEAATWVGPNIMRTSKALGLRSEASARFEKQLHPEQAIAAQRLAARLMVELCGARFVPGTIDVYPNPARAARGRAARGAHGAAARRADPGGARAARSSTGSASSATDGLGSGAGRHARWRVPPWRDADVQREADLIEEVARIHGLDKLPTTLPARERRRRPPDEGQRLRRRLEDLLRDRGLYEAIAYSFTAPARSRGCGSATSPCCRSTTRSARTRA